MGTVAAENFYIQCTLDPATPSQATWQGSLDGRNWSDLGEWFLLRGYSYYFYFKWVLPPGVSLPPNGPSVLYIVTYFLSDRVDSCSCDASNTKLDSSDDFKRYAVRLGVDAPRYMAANPNDVEAPIIVEASDDMQLEVHLLVSGDPKIKLGNNPGTGPKICLTWDEEGAWSYSYDGWDDHGGLIGGIELPHDCTVEVTPDGESFTIEVADSSREVSAHELGIYNTLVPGAEMDQGYVLNCHGMFGLTCEGQESTGDMISTQLTLGDNDQPGDLFCTLNIFSQRVGMSDEVIFTLPANLVII